MLLTEQVLNIMYMKFFVIFMVIETSEGNSEVVTLYVSHKIKITFK